MENFEYGFGMFYFVHTILGILQILSVLHIKHRDK